MGMEKIKEDSDARMERIRQMTESMWANFEDNWANVLEEED
jgi:hypothetical protein